MQPYSSTKKILVQFQNGGQITDFHFASFQFRRRKKSPFPQEFFNEIWLKIRDNEYINIAEIKFRGFYSGVILGARFFSSFSAPRAPVQFMLISANITRPISFFPLQLKIINQKYCESQENNRLVLWYPPYAVKC